MEGQDKLFLRIFLRGSDGNRELTLFFPGGFALLATFLTDDLAGGVGGVGGPPRRKLSGSAVSS